MDPVASTEGGAAAANWNKAHALSRGQGGRRGSLFSLQHAKAVRSACHEGHAPAAQELNVLLGASTASSARVADDEDEVTPSGSVRSRQPSTLEATGFPVPKPPVTTAESIRALLDSKLNVLLIFCVLGPAFAIFEAGDGLVFFGNFLAILPLAQLLGTATEEVALRTNEAVGGLINASLGNATELIISIFAIKEGLLRITQVSLLGSILSNQLLVMGLCFLCGGMYYEEQGFNEKMASVETALLMFLVLALSIPAVYNAAAKADHRTEAGFPCNMPCRAKNLVEISRFVSCILLAVYGLLLYFQLKTHKHIVEETKPSQKKSEGGGEESEKEGDEGEEEEDEEEEPSMTLSVALSALTVCTLMIAVCSEYLVGSIEGFADSLGLSDIFIGLILLPIVGNAAEHMTAVTVAMKGKMDLALGVALGSSLQIGLCVIPVSVLLAWGLGQELTLDFHMMETTLLVASCLVVNSTLADFSSTWLEGVILTCAYVIISVTYFYGEVAPDGRAPVCECGDDCCFFGGEVPHRFH